MRRSLFAVAIGSLFVFSTFTPAQTVVGTSVNQRSPQLHDQSAARTPYEAILLPRLQSLKQQQGRRPSIVTSVPLVQAANTPDFGGFSAAPLWNANPGESAALVSGDFNHDGKPDVANIQTGGEIDVLLNDGSGGLKAPIITQIPMPQPAGFNLLGGAVAVDLNGDGFADLVLSASQSDNQYNLLLVLMNQKNGQFGAPSILAIPNLILFGAFEFAVAATTSSGNPDIVTAELNGTNQARVQTFLNNGSAAFTAQAAQTFTFPASESSTGPLALVLNDSNHDGKQDIVLEQSRQGIGEYVYVLSGNGDGTFQSPWSQAAVTFPWPQGGATYSTLFVQNLTADAAKSDLIFSNGGGVYVAMSNGDGTYKAPNQVVPTESITQIDVVDLNGDGKADLITVGWGVLTSYLGNGDGTFSDISGAVVSSGDSSYSNRIHTFSPTSTATGLSTSQMATRLTEISK
jgi:FG-GAP-like repeat